MDKSILQPPDERVRPGKRKGKKESDGTIDPVKSKPPLIQVQQFDQDTKGFRVVPACDETPVSVAIKVAYFVRRGRPLCNYHPYDFTLGKDGISIEAENAKITRCEQNELEADIEHHDFSITIAGFDENRDLFVKVTPVRAVSDSEI